jgi:shikimate dehydrogenase
MDICVIKNRVISGKTLICGIIGDPIEHSLSPAMQNAAFDEEGLDYIYVPFRVKKEELGKAIQGLRGLGICGLNVTIPHKITVMPFLDEIEPLAQKIGAVNTITNEEGFLTGYNTDASGFLRALTAEKIDPKQKNICILGAGGAARAIVFILADRGANLTILNRHPGPAKKMASRILQYFRREAEVMELNKDNLKTALKNADVLVNTTSVGMMPEAEDTPVPLTLLSHGLVVFDIIYNPLKTRLLTGAEERGAKIISGLQMLVWQGAAAFELWTGMKAPVETMRETAIEALKTLEN